MIQLVLEGANHRTNVLALVTDVSDREDRLVRRGFLLVSNTAQRHGSPTSGLSATTGFERVAEFLLTLVFRFFVFADFLVDGFTVVESLVPSVTLAIISTYETPSPSNYKDHGNQKPERNGDASRDSDDHGVLFVSV